MRRKEGAAWSRVLAHLVARKNLHDRLGAGGVAEQRGHVATTLRRVLAAGLSGRQAEHADVVERLANYHRAREIIEEICEINRELLRRREAF